MNIIFKIKFLYKSDESYMNTTRKKLIFLNIKFKRERLRVKKWLKLNSSYGKRIAHVQYKLVVIQALMAMASPLNLSDEVIVH